MSKAYVVGDKAQILGFKGIGFEVIHADDTESLTRALGQLIRDNDASIVLVSENLASEGEEVIANFCENSQAILSTIPTHKGSEHLGFASIRRMIEYSIGVDMLGKE